MTGLGMSNAHADTTATGSTTHSPGVGSGNLIQLPINAPINVCGNQLDVIGILDSVTGNSCANESHGGDATTASGNSAGSPGVGSGNLIQVPINAPINVCGNQVDVIGIGNTDQGNSCANHGGGSTSASGSSSGSPGVVAGNLIQVPINAPVNVCGNQLDVIGILDSVTGNSCANGGHGNGRPPTPSPTPTTPTPTPTSTPTGTGCGCTPPPPPPPTTPCPPSGTATPTPVSSSSTPATTPSPSASGGGWSGGGSNGGGSNSGGASGSSGGSSGQPTGVLAHTGSSALAAAPFGAGLIGGGVMLRKRYSKRSH